MRKRRILAVLLAACMIVESTAVVSAAEISSVNTVGTETDPAAEKAGVDDAGDSVETDIVTESEADAPERPAEEQPAEDDAEKSEENTVATPAEGSEGEIAEEEYLVGAAEVMGVEPQADNKPIQGGTDIEITELKLRQEYGAIALVWSYGPNTAIASFDHCNVYRSETENGDYELIWETSDDDAHYTYLDNAVERVVGGAANKTYYYKVSVVYNRTEKNENGGYGDSELYESKPASISNEGAYYYEDAYPFFLNDKPDYVGAYVTNNAGSRLDSLTITEGVPESLRLTFAKEDGTKEQLSGEYYTGWYLCKRYYTGQEIQETYSENFDKLGSDKIRIAPETNLSEETTNDLHVNMTALNGSARDEDYYLVVKISHSHLGWFVWQIPVHIDEGDGTYTPPSEVDGVHMTKESLCQAIRDAMVAREKETVLYATGGNEWWNVSTNNAYLDLDFEDVFDFHREREGMKPWEGDYLGLAIGDASSEVYFGTWLKLEDSGILYGDRYLQKYTITPSFITTKEQEAWVNQQIEKIIRQPGGDLYNYQNASDYDKIKAAYEYVRKNVSYIGTKTPIYHTCYSALYNKKATCQGYALLYYRLVRELGIPCRVLMGTDANAHTYNIVKIDGAWYYVDTSGGVFLKGSNEFKPATLQSQYLTGTFKKEYIDKISRTSYAVSGVVNTPSQLEQVECLAAGEAKDVGLVSVDGMTAKYTTSGTTIKASGTVKYTEGCIKHLGYEEETSGYFLALKLQMDPKNFGNGKITVSYLDESGEQQDEVYDSTKLDNGWLKLLLNINREDPRIMFGVDNDTDGANSVYDETVYSLDISALKKANKSEDRGKVTEITAHGIGLSSPIITSQNDGKEFDVTYTEVIGYSDKVTLTDQDGIGGNYIALQMDMPESVKTTAFAEKSQIQLGGKTLEKGWNPDADCYIAFSGNSAIQFMMPVTAGFSTKEFTIKWGSAEDYALVQKLKVSVPATCILEDRKENAILPGSIAFNGLVNTMYVGQSQNAHVTFKKQYEQDEIQVYYTSDAADVVVINRITGVIKALNPGTATITASAVDSAGKVISKSAKITVKELPAPTGIKISEIKDNNVTVSWKANTTGQCTEVYAIPYDSTKFSAKKTEWKAVIENAMRAVGMEETILADADKTEMLGKLKATLGDCVAVSVPAEESSVKLEGLQKETEYVFYVRSVSTTVASTTVFCGATTDKIKTKGIIFDSIRLEVTDGVESAEILEIEENEKNISVYAITENDPLQFSYVLLDSNEGEIDAEISNVKYNTSNTNIAKVVADKATGQFILSYGKQVGDARITVSGKDASGVLRTSDPIIIRVIGKPTKLTAKTATLAIGESIPIRELFGTDLKGSAEGINLEDVDFDDALNVLEDEVSEDSKCFEISYPDDATDQNPEDALITATALIEGKSGKGISVPFRLFDSDAADVKATIKVNSMKAPSIGKITVKDTSAVIEFTPSSAVTKEETGSRYYTLSIKDKVTGKTVTVTNEGDAENPFTSEFEPFGTGKTWICEVTGLSSNKTYEATITACFMAADSENPVPSKSKNFTTSKPLLVSAGSIDVNYIDLDELRAMPTETGEMIDYDAPDGIVLESNRTYVFMAQISNLARTLETDKLKWAISSGEKKAASIKASSSSYEMQLTTTRTGTFTVTATSTITKEAVATFEVTVIPYQSGGAGNPISTNNVPYQAALLPEMDTGSLFRSRREDVA